MEYALIGLLVLAFLVLARMHHLATKAYEHLADIHERYLTQAQDERRELLNRIQHPERMPVKAPAPSGVTSNISESNRHALAQVGRVAPQVSDGD